MMGACPQSNIVRPSCCLRLVVPSNGASEAVHTAKRNKAAQPTAELYQHTGANWINNLAATCHNLHGKTPCTNHREDK